MSPVQMGRVEEALRLAIAFLEAFNLHDAAAIGALLSEDCTFETSGPAPLGLRHEGRVAVTQAIGEFFSATPDLKMNIEDVYGLGSRAVLRWVLTGIPLQPEGRRGVDLFTAKAGHITEILAYAKG